eukprot:TRINITY_DN7384_c0_g1_i1.p1 TRINITY_DN7384_c0_g1~~TRINITY_DN7384_c0_g1_i1.p1  ORF type:complete len:230 (-),score=3.68 TRINITY_DN7384_c0_g1_i1:225-914(-)
MVLSPRLANYSHKMEALLRIQLDSNTAQPWYLLISASSHQTSVSPEILRSFILRERVASFNPPLIQRSSHGVMHPHRYAWPPLGCPQVPPYLSQVTVNVHDLTAANHSSQHCLPARQRPASVVGSAIGCESVRATEKLVRQIARGLQIASCAHLLRGTWKQHDAVLGRGHEASANGSEIGHADDRANDPSRDSYPGFCRGDFHVCSYSGWGFGFCGVQASGKSPGHDHP